MNCSIDKQTLMDFIASPAFQAILIGTLIAILLWLAVAQKLLKSSNFEEMSLEDSMQAEEGYSIKEIGTDELIGQTGTAFTDMNISGKIDINGNRFDAITQGEFLEKGTPIVVVENRGNYFVVTGVDRLE